MKYILLSGLMGLSVILFKTRPTSHLQQSAPPIECAPPETNPAADVNGRYIPALSGWGHHVFVISTKQDSAQFFFNQGINLYFSYHLKDAQASFMEAARFDSSAGMAYWGEALSMGPYYNSYSYSMKPAVPACPCRYRQTPAGGHRKREQADGRHAEKILDRLYECRPHSTGQSLCRCAVGPDAQYRMMMI